MSDYKTICYKMMGRVADAVELLINAQREGERAAMEDAGVNCLYRKNEG